MQISHHFHYMYYISPKSKINFYRLHLLNLNIINGWETGSDEGGKKYMQNSAGGNHMEAWW
jgi:hypothetical protein